MSSANNGLAPVPPMNVIVPPTWAGILAHCKTLPRVNVIKAVSAEAISLKELEIKVRGTDASNPKVIHLFSVLLKQNVEVEIDKVTVFNLMHNFGKAVFDKVKQNKDDLRPYSIAQVKSWISLEAGRMPKIRREDMLGTGLWEVDNKIVAIGADVAVINSAGKVDISSVPDVGNKVIILNSEKPWFSHQELIDNARSAVDPQWCKDVVVKAVSVFGMWDNFTHGMDSKLITALVATTWLQSVWNWRPTVAITGPTMSGKTTLVKVIKDMFSGMYWSRNNPTEASIRIDLANNSFVVMLDEFEKATPQKQKVYELLRSAGDGEATSRATADQKTKVYRVNVMPWLIAINLAMSDTADKNRQIRMELGKIGKDRKGLFVRPDPDDMRKLGAQLMAVTVQHYREIRDAATQIQKLLAGDDLDARIAESYALPAAFLGVVLGVPIADMADEVRMLVEGRESVQAGSLGSDEANLMEDILSSDVIFDGGKRRSVEQLLDVMSGKVPNHDMTLSSAEMKEGLRKVGIKFMLDRQGKQWLFVNHRIVKRKLLRDLDRWEGELDSHLLRIDPGRAKRAVQRILDKGGDDKGGDKVARGIMIPWDAIVALMSGVTPDDDGATGAQHKSVLE